MTSVTFALFIYNCQGTVVLHVEFWSQRPVAVPTRGPRAGAREVAAPAERSVMIERGFVTAGSAPRLARIQALAFHDGAGRIRHMHHAITLEGAEPRACDAILEDASTQAREMGVDLARLRVLPVTAPFNLGAEHKIDVKKGVLVEVRPRRPGEPRSRGAARPARGTARSTRRR